MQKLFQLRMVFWKMSLCFLIALMGLPYSAASASNAAYTQAHLENKANLDRANDGVHIDDVVYRLSQVNTAVSHEDMGELLSLIDPYQHTDDYYLYQMLNEAEYLLNDSSIEVSEEVRGNLQDIFDAAQNYYWSAVYANQRELDQQTLILCNAILAFQNAIIVGPLEITTPEDLYIAGSYGGDSEFTVNGGISPYTFSIVSGAFPAQITLSPSSGYWDWLSIPNGDYTFTLRVTDPSGNYIDKSITVHAVPYIAPIYDLSVLPGNGKATFTFSPSVGATSVKLEKSTDHGSTWEEETSVTLNSTSESAEVTGLTNGQRYEFRLQATGGAHAGITSSVFVQPEALLAESGDSTVTLQFEPGESLTVEQSVYGGLYWSEVEGLNLTSASTSAVINGLTNGKVYQYRLTSGGSVVSNIVTAVPQPPLADPAYPTFGYTMRTSNSAIITFNSLDSSNIGIQHVINGDYTNNPIVSAVLENIHYKNSTYAKIINLNKDTRYLISVGSGPYVFTAISELNPAVQLTARPGFGEATINYDIKTLVAVANQARLQQRLSSETEWTDAATVDTSSKSTKVTDLNLGETYHFRMIITGPTYTEVTDEITVTIDTGA